MPESASAVSQLTEEEHSWGRQMKGAERGGGGGDFERKQRCVKCFKMADVRRQRRPVPGVDAW